MWNYSYVFPSLLILFILVSYYFMLPRIPIRMNRTFIHLIGIECVVMIMDIISSWADMNYQLFPRWALYALNNLYFIAFFARALFFCVFTISVLRLEFLNNHFKYLLVMVPFVLESVLVLITPFTRNFYYMDDTGYHSGPLYNTLYLLFWLYLGISFFAILTHKERPRSKREFNTALWINTILLIGTICRLAFPQYLLMDTFCLIALLVSYLSYMNPDFYLEGRTWIFNARAIREYLDEINGQKKYRIFAFAIHDYRDVRELYGIRQMDHGVNLICDYLKKTFPNKIVFYYRSGRFGIVCDDIDNIDKIHETLQEKFSEPWVSDDVELYVEIGCALLNPGDRKLDYNTMTQVLMTAFNEADLAEKHEIRVIDEAGLQKAEKELEIKRAIEYAVDHDAVEIFLQPIMDAATGKLAGAEALARIGDAEGNIIPPGLFIPIAEHNGRISELGTQVFIKTCKFIKENNTKELGLNWINVNLSPIQFMKANLGNNLMHYIKKYDIDPRFIHLEITEEAMVDDQLLVYQTNMIKEMGFHFVLDDYGKGYSNLTRLKRCPFINIKLDMSIVWDYCRKPDVMLPNMVKTFASMGFGITAEGIESEYMAQTMAALGCTYLQGYYYSKPISVDEFIKKYSQG